MRDILQVRQVCGHYPTECESELCSDNIEVTIQELARVFCVRLEDTAHPEMVMEIILEIETA